MPDVFISYAREDNARAEQVARALEGAGLEVFWDSEIPPGQTWADYIESKLTNCKAVIVLWSEHSTRSQWVREEARMGRDKGKLIPVMLDGSAAPFGFGEVQAANLHGWNGEPSHPDWARTLSAVQAAVAREPGAAAPPPPPAAPRMAMPPPAQPAAAPPPQNTASKRPWYLNPLVLIGGTIVAVIAVLGVIGATMQDTTATMAQTPSAPPATPQPQPPGQQRDVRVELQAKLSTVTGYMQQEGFQPVGEPFVHGLNANATQDIPATLHTGFEYRLVAVCDNDCSDVDLWLYDQNNNEVASDVAVDAQPIVQVAPRWTGPFTLRVGMIQCAVAPCYVAAQLYGRTAQ